MCFSAPASFTAGAALIVAGGYLVAKVKERRFLALALIPCFFALQQAAEGFLWLGIAKEQPLFKNIFLFFAYPFWPLWIPFALWIAEKVADRKQLIAIGGGIGIVVATVLAMIIPDVSVLPYRFSIQYLFQNDQLSQFDRLALFFYACATVIPFFLSTIKKIWVLGLFIAFAGVVIDLIDRLFFVSMWCFFAAIISLGLILILPRRQG